MRIVSEARYRASPTPDHFGTICRVPSETDAHL